jgi:hypothetical protein
VKFWYAVSFESDIHPVETIRGEVEAPDVEDAVKRACYRAVRARVGKWKCPSLSVVVEELAARAQKSPNKSGGRAATLPADEGLL